MLKDAASTAIYGSQGANGVIVITTKMGKKGETVRYHSNIGVSTMGHDVEMLPASDYLAMMKQANPGFDAQGGAIDWSGQAVRTAITHSHHISVSGAKDRTRHYLSLGYSGDQGILRRTDQGILNLRANFERTINKNSLIGVRGNFGHVRNNMTQGTSPLGSMSTLKAMTEAEAYHGPSLIIAYAPCINHGINMGHAQEEIKKAVKAGYWPLYRYNPALAEEGKNPMTVDSKDPTESYQDFLKGEVRYASLAKLFPDKAEALFEQNEKDAAQRLAMYKKLAGE